LDGVPAGNAVRYVRQRYDPRAVETPWQCAGSLITTSDHVLFRKRIAYWHAVADSVAAARDAPADVRQTERNLRDSAEHHLLLRHGRRSTGILDLLAVRRVTGAVCW